MLFRLASLTVRPAGRLAALTLTVATLVLTLGTLISLPGQIGPLLSPAFADEGEGGGGAGDRDGGDRGERGDRGDRGDSGEGSKGESEGGGEIDRGEDAGASASNSLGDDGDDDEGEGDDEGDEPEEASEAELAESIDGGISGQNDRFVADEVVALNLSDTARAEIRRLGFVVLEDQVLAALGLRVTRTRVPRSLTAPAARALLEARFPGTLFDVNSLYRLQGDQHLPVPDYGKKLIGWGHAPSSCGAGLILGIVDTAVDEGDHALRGARIVQRSFLPAGAMPAPTDHATAVAGILAGPGAASGGQGLLPGATVAVAEVFSAEAEGGPISDSVAVIRGLDWLVSAGARVINISLAGHRNALLSLVVERLVSENVVLVAAAGNEGPDAQPAYPAAEPSVIGVTAVDGRSQPYSRANRGAYVDFAAPGVRIWTPGPAASGRYVTGTSFAAPFVAAAVASAIARGESTDPESITSALAGSAIDLGAPGKDSVFGWGLIQMTNPCADHSQQPLVD